MPHLEHSNVSQRIPVFALFYYMAMSNLLFPFYEKGERYTSCTEADSHGLEWCSTLTDVLDNHLTGYWGNCDSLENELAQVLFMSLVYLQNYEFKFIAVYLIFQDNSYENSRRVLLQSSFAGKKRYAAG